MAFSTKPRLVSFIPALLWFVLSFFLFTLPGSSFPPNEFFEKIQLDKWVHIALFSILVALCYWPFKPSWPQKAFLKKAVPIAFAALGYGIAIEFIQKNYIPNRSFDLGDIIADGFGSFIPLVYVLRAGKKKAGGKAGT